MAWLGVGSPAALLEKAAAASWDTSALSGGAAARPAEGWERQPEPLLRDNWAHEVLRCPRAEGDVAVHRFTPRQPQPELLASLLELVRHDMAAGTALSDPASNIGGWHGQRDLWMRPAFHRTGLPQHISAAIKRATQSEAAALGALPVSTSCDEAWFNVCGAGGWNRVHTHAASTYACVFFVADGGCCATATPSGRLVFVPNQPETLPDYHLQQVRRRGALPKNSTEAAKAAHAALPERAAAPERAAKRRKVGAANLASPQFLAIDPVPGTCVVFPAFLPHFVVPAGAQRQSATDQESGEPRVSIALNFGACDPIIMCASSFSSQPPPQASLRGVTARHTMVVGEAVKVILEVDEGIHGI